MNSTCAPVVVVEAFDGLGPVRLPQPPSSTDRSALLAGLENRTGSLHAQLSVGIDTTSCWG